MFKKYYKQANDDIETNRALIDKIFEEAEKPIKVKPFGKIYKFGIAAAAVLVIGVSATLFSMYGGSNTKVNHLPVATKTEESDINRDGAADKEIQHIENGMDEIKDRPVENAPMLANVVDEKSGVNSNTIEKNDNINNDSKKGNQVNSSKKEENAVPKNQQSEQTQNKVEPIKPIQSEVQKTSEQTDNGVMLAMETETNGISVYDGKSGRIADEPQNNDTTINELNIDEIKEISDAEYGVIHSMLIACFGEKDETTGNEYIFEIVGKTDNVYLGRWRWFVDGHSSLLTEFVITADMSGMYECTFTDDGKGQWSTEKNLLFQ